MTRSDSGEATPRTAHPGGSRRRITVGRLFHFAASVLRRGGNFGHCPVCGRSTLFVRIGPWARDEYRCLRCASIPRQRALFAVLEAHFPQWRTLRIHESSPSGAPLRRMRAQCPAYVPTHFFPDCPPGRMRDGVRCEDLARQSFEDDTFDVVITQDVMEHLLEPIQSLREICRTLKPGGSHVFTVPWYHWQETRVRARKGVRGIDYLHEPDYHINPIDEHGSLVVTEWGRDLCETIFASCGMTTTVHRILDRRRGIDAAFIEVFVSTKRATPAAGLLERWAPR